jgi:RNA recognition motif-containing protein
MSRFGRGPPPDTTGMVSLKVPVALPVPTHNVASQVDNLSNGTTADDVEYLFEKYGKIGDVFLPKGRGFAFVRFYERHDADDAIDALNGKEHDGRPLRIEDASYRRPQDGTLRAGGWPTLHTAALQRRSNAPTSVPKKTFFGPCQNLKKVRVPCYSSSLKGTDLNVADPTQVTVKGRARHF